MRAKWSAPIRKYWKISEQMMVKYCDLAICDKVNKVVLKDAFAATCNKRGTDHLQEQAEEIIKIIEADTVM